MSVTLHNKFLKVLIGEPGEWYKGSRFDHTGNIRQVTLFNKYNFCTTEKPIFSVNSGFGLLNEFDIKEPAGYHSASVGEEFHKIGIGYLTKEDTKPYDFFNPYPIRSCKIVTTESSETSIVFLVDSAEVRGMKYRYRKNISIIENNLVIKYQLANKGTKSFRTTEYCHNFIGIEDPTIWRNYSLKFDAPIEKGNFTENVNTGGILFAKNELCWKGTPRGDFFIGNLLTGHSGVNTWQLENSKTGISISERVNFPVYIVNLWGSGHVISPELFFNVNLEPQEEISWERKYAFSTG